MSALLAENRKEIKDPELRMIYRDTMEHMILSGRSVVSMDGDLMRAMATWELSEKYPEQVIECGIAEGNMVGVAAGLSAEGFVPFVHSFGAFACRRTYDQVFMSCAYAKLNVKIIGSDPGVIAALNGGTHTANEDIAAMRVIPGMKLVDITDAVMAGDLLPKIADDYGVYYVRYPRCRVTRVYDEKETFEIGKAKVVRDGCDLTIIASGIEVSEALDAADELSQEQISARVIDMFTIKPLDEEAVIRAARETGAIVTAENANQNGGLGEAVAACIVKHDPVPMECVANLDRFGDVGSVDYLMGEYGLTAEVIAEKARAVLRRKKGEGR